MKDMVIEEVANPREMGSTLCVEDALDPSLGGLVCLAIGPTDGDIVKDGEMIYLNRAQTEELRSWLGGRLAETVSEGKP